MGWTGQFPPAHRDKKRWLTEEFTGQSDDFRWTLTDVSVKGNRAYGIYHQEDKKTGISLHETMVFLLSFKADEWCYKEMGETVHPYYYDCPKTLLDKIEALYPPFNDNAMAWRAKCREHHAKQKVQLKDGDVVKFDRPLSFGWFTENTFTVVKQGAKVSFRAKNGILCSITKWRERDYQVIADVNLLVNDYLQQHGVNNEQRA